MITIDEVKKAIKDFKIDVSEVNAHANEQDEYINQEVVKAEQLKNAMRLLKIMIRNNLDKIEESYYINPDKKKVIIEDDDVSKFYDPLPTEGWFSIIILDKESPLYLQKVSIMVKHMFSDNECRDPRIIGFFVDDKETNYTNDQLGMYKEGKYPPIHDTIMDYIQYTKDVNKQLDDIRKITSIENNLIGE